MRGDYLKSPIFLESRDNAGSASTFWSFVRSTLLAEVLSGLFVDALVLGGEVLSGFAVTDLLAAPFC